MAPRSRHRRLPRALPAALLCLVVTACGSTVQTSTSAQVGGGTGSGTGSGSGSGDGLGTSSLGTDSGTGQATGGSTGTTGGSGSTGGTFTRSSSGSTGGTGGSTTGGGGTTGGSTGGSGGSTGAGSGGGPATTGLGVTAKTITVGATVTSNGDAANSAIGASGITQGDDRANIRALQDEINARGGIAGRKLEVVVHAYDAQSTQPGATQDAAACSDFTEDHQVMAVFSTGLTDSFPECLRKAGVVQFSAGALVGEDRAFSQRYPQAFQLGTMTQERILRDTVGALARQKYFTGWNALNGQAAPTPAKVAVLSYDQASSRNAVASTLLPALKAAGHPVDSAHVFFVHLAENQSDLSGTVAGIKSATLRMQQDGITHLVFNDLNGLLLGLFGTNAQSQQYYPRFGVTSGAGPQAIYDSGLVTAKQLNGMAGNGWLPSIDLPAADGTKYSTPATARCLDIMKRRTGQTYTSTNAASIALIECDSFFLLAQALTGAPSLSPAGLVAGMESIGTSFTSALLPAAFLSPAQHDDGVRAFDLNWVADCTCVRYTSPRTVPS